MTDLEHLLRTHLVDSRTGWSMGSFGAIAEFHQDQGEFAVVDDTYNLTRATRRGGIKLRRSAITETKAVAYETLSPKRHRWSQAVALCLPVQAATRSVRTVLTELGPDDDAIRGVDRTGILFDLGLGLPQCDFCIRTSEPKLLAALRAGEGMSVFDHGNPAMPAVLAGHPNRVALTNIGRVEVYQKIGGPDTDGRSPPGPHTHLLPKLLRSGRTHSANTPIPEGFLPLGSMHPGNPVIDHMGEDRAFDAELHRTFQKMIGEFGQDGVAALKQRVRTAVADGVDPSQFVEPATRWLRSALRLTLRQEMRAAEHLGDAGAAIRLNRWQSVFEPAGTGEEEDDDAPGH